MMLLRYVAFVAIMVLKLFVVGAIVVALFVVAASGAFATFSATCCYFFVDDSFVVVINIDSVANEERARGERERDRRASYSHRFSDSSSNFPPILPSFHNSFAFFRL